MKRILLTLIFFFTFISFYAQMPNRGGGGGDNNDPKNKGGEFDFRQGFSVVLGSIRDAVTKQPIEYASVSLIRTQDSAAQCGMITGGNGKFRFEKLPVGNYMALVSFIGYRQYRGEAFVINHSSYKIDLGTLEVQPLTTNLKEVEVATNQATFEMHSDKKVFNVDKNLTTVSGTASDVLRNVPSVTVDQDGNVSLRGKSNVTILIDNKPSSLGSDLPTVLQQIPANAIENIEVITNPSAKYSAEGVTGIINIVMKKNKLQGYNGVLIGGLGSNSALTRINKYNATGTYNFRTEKFNVSTTYSFRDDQRVGWGVNSKDLLSQKIDKQVDTTYYKSLMNYGKVSVDYNLNAFNTVGAYVSLFRLNTPPSLTSNGYIYDSTPQNSEQYITRRSLVPQKENFMYSIAPGLIYRRTFVVPKHTLDIDASTSEFHRYSGTLATDHSLLSNTNSNETNNSNARLRMYNVQADYSKPIKEDNSLDLGYKMTTFDLDITNDVFTKTAAASDYTKDQTRSTVTKTMTLEHALYASYSGKITEKLDYQVGLRGEYARKDIAIKKYNSSIDSINFSKSYPDLFPSAFFTYKMKENRSIGLSYSRRVERPDFMQIIPVRDYSIPKQPRQGNPNLNPEYTHAMEFNYSKTWDDHSLNFSLYDYYTNNTITYQRQLLSDGSTLTTFENAKKTNDYGVDIVIKNKLYRWWDITTSVNAYQTQLNGDNLGLGTTNAFQGNIHVVSAFRPDIEWSKHTSLQLTGFYQTKQTLIQGYIEPSFSFDFGLKKEWGKTKQYSLNLSVNDIFNQRKFVIHTKSGDFNLLADRRFDSRTVSLSFMYRYGKLETPFYKKKKTEENKQNMMGGDGF